MSLKAMPAMPRVSGPLQGSSISAVPSLAGAAFTAASIGRASVALPALSRVAVVSRVRLAIPIGALAAVLALATGYLMTSSGTPAPVSGAAALSVESSAPVIRLDATAAPAVDAVSEPEHQADSLIEMDDDEIARRPAAAKRRPARKAKTSRKRPRRIVAGDVSTPLGNLRPRKAW